MVAPRRRSTSSKKRSIKTPGGKVHVIYKPKRHSKPICAICATRLHGVPNRSISGMAKLSKTQKRPERIFGGVLCGNCIRHLVKEKIRMESGNLSREEVGIVHLKYLDMMKK
ncbi:MAG: 50S ribosomal protein L34e [Candidatus Micrarchaeota archaeon]